MEKQALQEHLCGALRRAGVDGDTPLLAAVSGGVDSVALLHLLCALRREGEIGPLSAAHFHHGIRGADADADAALVKELCAAWGVPFSLGRGDVPALRRASGASLEEAARVARYAFLREQAARGGARYIVTAHHMEDQAETVLLHLLRGSGRNGLCGMRPAAGDLLRPLLGAHKAQLLAYAAQHGLPSREDATNRDTAYTRNSVRLRLLPLLQREYNPNIIDRLCGMAELLREDEDYLERLAAEAMGRAMPDEKPPRGCRMYDRAALAALPGPVQSRALRLMLREAGALQGAQRSDVQRLRQLLGGRTGAWIALPGGQCAWVSYEMVVIGPQQTERDAIYAARFCWPGITKTPGGAFRAEFTGELRRDGGAFTAYFDADKLPAEAEARPRRPGDRFHPLGAPGKKKLKDYLIDKKIPRGRRELPLLAAGSTVLFFPGGGSCHFARVTKETRRILRVVFEEDK